MLTNFKLQKGTIELVFVKYEEFLKESWIEKDQRLIEEVIYCQKEWLRSEVENKSSLLPEQLSDILEIKHFV